MSIPDDRKYSETHQWLRREDDGTYTVGITFHAQDMLGDVVFVQNPEAGRKVAQGEEVGVVESVKTAADIYAPVSGEILEANPALEDAPEKINDAPYSAWMFRIRPDDPGEIERLLDAAAYHKVAEADKASR
jgi:glycine cleavage system H protein